MPITVTGRTSVNFDAATQGAIQAFTIKVAEQALRDAVSRGFDSEPVVITDGVPNRDWRQVKPYGKIEWARRPDLKDCALWIMSELVRRAPIGPGRNGHYVDRFVFLVNDYQIDQSQLDDLKPGDRVQIVNTQPYAKKLEGMKADRKAGLKRVRGSSRQAPGGIFIPVQRDAVARFGRTLWINYRLVKLVNNGGMPRVWRVRNHRGHRLRTPYSARPLFPSLNLRLQSASSTGDNST